jgi:dimethylargininase
MRALMRAVPSSFARALAASPPPVPIDVALAREQHDAVRRALESMGAVVTLLEADDACPDCCFVEDTAVVASGLALVTRPGAPSRRAETVAVRAALASAFEIATMEEPATLDGGDCMRVGRTIYVGRSARTNAAGIARLMDVFTSRGLRVVPVDLPKDVLHLKCVCSPLGGDRVLLARESLSPSIFGGAEIVWGPASESYAANVVAIGAHVLVAAEYPRTQDALTAAGLTLHLVPTSEVRKADGSLTCQSILLDA